MLYQDMAPAAAHSTHTPWCCKIRLFTYDAMIIQLRNKQYGPDCLNKQTVQIAYVIFKHQTGPG